MKKLAVCNSLFLAIGSLIVIGVTMTSISPLQAADDPIVVIVNGSNPVENLTTGELKKLFLSERSRWDTGKSVAPVMTAAGARERTAFLKIVCGMNDTDFGKYFLQAAFTGKSATPPKERSWRPRRVQSDSSRPQISMATAAMAE